MMAYPPSEGEYGGRARYDGLRCDACVMDEVGDEQRPTLFLHRIPTPLFAGDV
jgi:hypothetical protein